MMCPPYRQPLRLTVADAANTSLQALKGFATAAVNGLSNFVSVKQDGKIAAALLPPNQTYYLQQNLQLKLEAARLALLQQDNETFQAVLEAALAWTQQYFNPDADSTRQFTAELTRLKTLNVSPALPDISESLKVLREVQPNLS
ncbi:MAG: uroporphyrin-III C-methyltransferase [Halothiobacillaceae bacterium]|nr:MAG: uroporphyrin-III C-methyltransferase [Halothiobacillaceae bacterium]